MSRSRDRETRTYEYNRRSNPSWINMRFRHRSLFGLLAATWERRYQFRSKMVTCPTTSHFCSCGLDICPPYLGFPLRRTDLPQILYHDMGRPSLPWKIIFWLSTCVVLSVSLQEFSMVQERFIPPLLPNLVLPELAERWRFSTPSRDLSACKLVVL